MPVVKSRVSKSGYILLFLILGIVIALMAAHVFGAINLAFVGDWFLFLLMWGAAGILNGVLMLGASFALGAVTYYLVKKYFIGTEVPTTAVPYTPIGQTISQPQQKDETVVTS